MDTDEAFDEFLRIHRHLRIDGSTGRTSAKYVWDHLWPCLEDYEEKLVKAQAELELQRKSAEADAEHMSVLDREVTYLRAKFERIRDACSSSHSADERIESIYEILTDGR